MSQTKIQSEDVDASKRLSTQSHGKTEVDGAEGGRRLSKQSQGKTGAENVEVGKRLSKQSQGKTEVGGDEGSRRLSKQSQGKTGGEGLEGGKRLSTQSKGKTGAEDAEGGRLLSKQSQDKAGAENSEGGKRLSAQSKGKMESLEVDASKRSSQQSKKSKAGSVDANASKPLQSQSKSKIGSVDADETKRLSSPSKVKIEAPETEDTNNQIAPQPKSRQKSVFGEGNRLLPEPSRNSRSKSKSIAVEEHKRKSHFGNKIKMKKSVDSEAEKRLSSPSERRIESVDAETNKLLMSIRSVKDLAHGEYCDPNDPCCTKPDPEMMLHQSILQHQFRKPCAPRNPLHFEYTIIHRLRLKQKLKDLAAKHMAGGSGSSNEAPPQQKMSQAVSSMKVPELENAKEDGQADAEHQLPPAPEKLSPEELSARLEALGEMTLVHEIALDKDFHIRNIDTPINNYSRIVTDSKIKYWQKVDQVLIKKRKHQSEVKAAILDIMNTLRKLLLSILLPYNLGLKLRVEWELDAQKMAAEINANVFDFNKYMHFILDILSHLCCPIRDQGIVEIQEMIAEGVPFSRQVKRAVELIESIGLDMANFIMTQSRSHVIQQCIEYERYQFAKFLKRQYHRGSDPLLFTRYWIQSNCTTGKSFKEGIAAAFLEVLLKDDGENDCDWPETLSLDWCRIPPYRNEIRRVTIIGALSNAVYEYATSLVDTSSTETPENFEEREVLSLKNLRLYSKLREDLNVSLESNSWTNPKKYQEVLSQCSSRVVQEVDQFMTSEHCRSLQASEKEAINGIVLSQTDLNNPSRLEYVKRVTEWFLSEFQHEGRNALQVPSNLHIIAPLILNPITELLKIFNYNRAVFDVVYQEIYQGNCPPPTIFPSTQDSKAPTVLDANNPPNENEKEILDPGLAKLVEKLELFHSRTAVYRRSRIDAKTQPMYTADGTLIIPPEQQEKPPEEKLSPAEQKRLDEFLLENESTLDVDLEGVYGANIAADDPDWMWNLTSEQLIRLVERENIIRENKLKRIKKRMAAQALKKRVEENLPVFEKIWREDVVHLEQEFCRLQRIREKGEVTLPEGAQDEPRQKREFQGTCDMKSRADLNVNKNEPEYNDKGERIMYSRNRGEQFSGKDAITEERSPLDELEEDFFSRWDSDVEDDR